MAAFDAAVNNDFKEAARLLQGCDSVEAQPDAAAPPKDRLEVARILLKATKDTPNQGGGPSNSRVLFSPLHSAVQKGHVQMVKLLLKAEADVNQRNSYGKAPLHLAAEGGFVEVAKLLLEAGADVHLLTAEAKASPFMLAVIADQDEMAKFLIANGANVNQTDSQGTAPISVAASRGKVAVVKVLVEAGADLDVENIHGYTPLCDAVVEDHEEVALLLVDNEAELSQNIDLPTMCQLQAKLIRWLQARSAHLESRIPALEAEHTNLVASIPICCGYALAAGPGNAAA
mmetsp:Transcript_30497/g.86178  ORF Transcript_30497/g.86178 Transcript_30497/m.86178 type:complete len:287 (+) Transcript_30497:491-1351(+)